MEMMHSSELLARLTIPTPIFIGARNRHQLRTELKRGRRPISSPLTELNLTNRLRQGAARLIAMPKPLFVPDDQPCERNETLLQGFEWYCPADYKHWRRLSSVLPSLAALGISTLWIPPATRAGWHKSNGYDAYDLYDLGEFDQKGAKHTKWGTKDELVQLLQAASACGIRVLFDTVLNHKAAADYAETVDAVQVDPNGRLHMHYTRLASSSLSPASQCCD